MYFEMLLSVAFKTVPPPFLRMFLRSFVFCRFDNFAGLVGGFCAVPLALVYPSAFQLKMMGDSMTTIERVWAWTVLLFGSFAAMLCTWQSLATWK